MTLIPDQQLEDASTAGDRHTVDSPRVAIVGKRRTRGSLNRRVLMGLLFVTWLLQLNVALLEPPADRNTNSLLFIWVGTLSALTLLVQRLRRHRLNDPRTRRRIAAASERATSADDRRPVLYLRPFEMDAVVAELEAPETGPFGTLFGNPNPRTAEQNLQLALALVGPVDAIGNPSDRGPDGSVVTLPPPGIRKHYVDHPDWRSEVLSRIAEAQLVALMPGEDFSPGKGFMWELEQIKRVAEPERVVFFIPHGERYYANFRQATAPLLRNLPEYPRTRLRTRNTRGTLVPGMIQAVLYFDDSWKPVLAPLTEARRMAPRFAVIYALKPVLDRTGVSWRPRFYRLLGRQLALGIAILVAIWPGVLLFTAAFNAAFPGT